jgi:hypothetical protein
MTRSAFGFTAALLASLTIVACGDDDETAPEEGHTPHGAALFVYGLDASAGLVLAAGSPVRVEVRFVDDQGGVITGIEPDHHSALTFTPAELASVTSVTGHNFQKDVTSQSTPATGTVMVGYGHDEQADELSFGPFPVTVVASAGAR